MLKNIIKSFLPWILFSILNGSSQHQLDTAIIVAFATTLWIEIPALKKGFILSWGTMAFFTFMFIAVILFKNPWIAKHAWIFSNGTLALIAWSSILVRQPFTIQYAKEQVPQEHWQSPLFIKINYILTAVWGICFLFATFLNILQVYYPTFDGWVYQSLTNGATIFAIWFTAWYPKWAQKSNQVKTTAKNPYLQGNFAPIQTEINAENLTVIGEIPKELNGVYMRNGPNPAFPPISYTYPLDGDGMIHAIYFNEGKASYRNRFVETKGLLAERRAGHAIYGGIAHPIPVDPKLVGKDGDPGPFKDGAFIHVIRHAKQYLALWEGGPAYEMTRELQTLGEWCPPAAKSPFNVNAHSRRDPITGELHMFTYDIQPPYLTYYVIDPMGKLVKQAPIDKKYSSMMHDFVLTKNYAVFFDCPSIFDPAAAEKGESLLQWRPELGTKIGILSRHSDKITWLQTEPFFIFHFANAYEENNKIIVDYARHADFKMIARGKSQPPMLYRTIIDLDHQIVSHYQIDDRHVEFPRINDFKNSHSYRYSYMPTKPNGNYNGLVKYDMQQKSSQIHNFGEFFEIGEAVFAPKTNNGAEDEGYIMLFVYNKKENSSEFIILNAQDFTAEPLAKIKLPQRVPNGLHGSWMPD